MRKIKSFYVLVIGFFFALSVFGEHNVLAQESAEILVETNDVSLDRPFWVLFEISAPSGKVFPWPKDRQGQGWLIWTHPEWLMEGQTVLPIPKKVKIEGDGQYGFSETIRVLKEFIPQKRKAPQGSEDTFFIKMKASFDECGNVCVSKTLLGEVGFSLGQGFTNDSVRPNFISARENITVASPWPIRATVTPSKFQLDIYPNIEVLSEIDKVEFLPKTEGLIQTEIIDAISLEDSSFKLIAPRKWKADYFNTIEGMLNISWKDGRSDNHYWVLAKNTIPELMIFGDEALSDEINFSFKLAVLFAFFGGMILNLMPCVFPILTMKLFGLVKAGSISPVRMRLDGIAYTVGILVSFSLLTGALLFFKSLGAQVGWGFQLQSPYFILGLIYLFFLVGLNFSGLWEMPSNFAGFGQKLTEKEGVSAPFFTGVLATIVATPCTAPFMAPAIGYALTLAPVESLVIFLSLGVGLAFPYLLISFIPQIHKFLPKPGPWMVKFQKVLAVPIYLTLIWLLWVYAQQISLLGVAFAVGGLMLISLFVLFSRKERTINAPIALSKIRNTIVIISVLLISYLSLGYPQSNTINTDAGYKEGYELVQFSRTNLDRLRGEGRPVFVNFTAAWCITCLVHEKLVFNQPAVKKYFRDNDIVFMVADWTNPNPEISKILEEYERSGIPLYLFYPEGPWSQVKVLPEILTPQKLIELLGHET